MLLKTAIVNTSRGSGVDWLLWVALGFFALMVLVGWLSSRGRIKDEQNYEQEQENHSA